MFENAGKKVKDIAIMCFAVEILFVIFLALQIANAGYEFNFWAFILILVIGGVVSYLSVIMTIAFGELVENSSIIVSYLEKTALTEGNHKAVEPIFKDTTNSVTNASYGANSVGNGSVREGFWRCPKCGRENHHTVGTCGCGQSKNA